MKTCLEFVEWAAIKLFDPRYMVISHYIGKVDTDFYNSIGMKVDPYMYNLNGEEINGLKLYKIFCEDNGLTLSKRDKLNYYEMKLIPLEFLKFILNKKLFLFKYKIHSVEQEPYWTNGKSKDKITTSDLYKEFINI
jgi:hypothetical protein